MALTIKSITKMSDGRLLVTVEDMTQVIDEVEGICKTYSFIMPSDETPVGARARLEKAISADKKVVSDEHALKQTYATELEKVDPSKIGG